MLIRLWRIAQIAGIVIVSMVGFFLVLELLRAYVIMRDVHPVLGVIFLCVLLLGVIILAVWYWATINSRPQALSPPKGVLPATAAGRALRAYARFEMRLLRRLASNPNLPADLQTRVLRQRDRLREALAAGDEAADLRRCVIDTEELVITPAMAPLDTLAQQEVARSVRDVMLAVTLSPWRTADLVVVLYRNLRMVTQLCAIYNTRPTLGEQAAIVRDVFMIVASVNIFNYGSNLLQNLTASVPLLGRFAGDIAEGVGAGLMTSVTGHAAQDRCRCYGRWSQVKAEQVIRRKLREFLDDVKAIVIGDVLLRIRKPVEAQMPATVKPAEAEDAIRSGVTAAIDATSAVMDTYLMRPIAAAGRGAVNTGAAAGRAVAQGGASTWQGATSVVRTTWGWLAGLFGSTRESEGHSPTR